MSKGLEFPMIKTGFHLLGYESLSYRTYMELCVFVCVRVCVYMCVYACVCLCALLHSPLKSWPSVFYFSSLCVSSVRSCLDLPRWVGEGGALEATSGQKSSRRVQWIAVRKQKTTPSRTFLPAPCHLLRRWPGVQEKERLQPRFLLLPEVSFEILLT